MKVGLRSGERWLVAKAAHGESPTFPAVGYSQHDGVIVGEVATDSRVAAHCRGGPEAGGLAKARIAIFIVISSRQRGEASGIVGALPPADLTGIIAVFPFFSGRQCLCIVIHLAVAAIFVACRLRQLIPFSIVRQVPSSRARFHGRRPIIQHTVLLDILHIVIGIEPPGRIIVKRAASRNRRTVREVHGPQVLGHPALAADLHGLVGISVIVLHRSATGVLRHDGGRREQQDGRKDKC